MATERLPKQFCFAKLGPLFPTIKMAELYTAERL